jgi:hypothetical protein
MSTSCRKGHFPTCKISALVNWYLCVWSIVLMEHSIYLFWNSLPHFYTDCIKHLTRAITLGIPSVPIFPGQSRFCGVLQISVPTNSIRDVKCPGFFQVTKYIFDSYPKRPDFDGTVPTLRVVFRVPAGYMVVHTSVPLFKTYGLH